MLGLDWGRAAHGEDLSSAYYSTMGSAGAAAAASAEMHPLGGRTSPAAAASFLSWDPLSSPSALSPLPPPTAQRQGPPGPPSPLPPSHAAAYPPSPGSLPFRLPAFPTAPPQLPLPLLKPNAPHPRPALQ